MTLFLKANEGGPGQDLADFARRCPKAHGAEIFGGKALHPLAKADWLG
jgi:hypothetical protein